MITIFVMDIYYVFGILGAVLCLIAFLFRNNKKYGVGTKIYLLANLIGAGALVIYACLAICST